VDGVVALIENEPGGVVAGNAGNEDAALELTGESSEIGLLPAREPLLGFTAAACPEARRGRGGRRAERESLRQEAPAREPARTRV
jgi:hypothetical protein